MVSSISTCNLILLYTSLVVAMDIMQLSNEQNAEEEETWGV
jgi:hypothetical protein